MRVSSAVGGLELVPTVACTYIILSPVIFWRTGHDPICVKYLALFQCSGHADFHISDTTTRLSTIKRAVTK